MRQVRYLHDGAVALWCGWFESSVSLSSSFNPSFRVAFLAALFSWAKGSSVKFKRAKLSSEGEGGSVYRRLSGESSIGPAGRAARIDRKILLQWSIRYEAEGPSLVLPCEWNRTYCAEQKFQAVQDDWAELGSLMEIGKEYRLRDIKQLRNWLKVYTAQEDNNQEKETTRSEDGKLDA